MSILLVIGGVLAGVLQARGVAVLAASPALPSATGPAVVAIVAGALLGAAALVLLGRGLGQRMGVGEALSMAAMGLFVPVLGPPALGLLLASRSWRRGKAAAVEPRTVRPARLPGRPLHTDEGSRFGPGALEGILRHGADPEVRLRVVLACRQLPGVIATRLLRIALRDPVDDVRLLAYAVLDGRERQIQGAIHRLLSGGQGAGSGEGGGLGAPAPSSHARLAELFWELAYQGLVEGELLSFTLDRVLHHAREAERVRPQQRRLALLAGRALLRKGLPDQARAAFSAAVADGLPESLVAPYLAEAAFAARRPQDIRRHIGSLGRSVRFRPALGPLVASWDGGVEGGLRSPVPHPMSAEDTL
jgi:hypothetical protein